VDPESGVNPGRGWEETLLLEVHGDHLDALLNSLPESSFRQDATEGGAKRFSELACVCVHFLQDMSLLRVSRSLETLLALLQHLMRKRFADDPLGLLGCLGGDADSGERMLTALVNRCVVIVSSEGNPSCARVLAAQLLLVVLTFRSNVNRNPLTTFFLQPSAPVWAMVMKVLGGRDAPELQAYVLQLFVLLLGWREGGNPFAGRLRDMTHPQQAALLACINRHMRPNTLAPQCAAAAASSSCVPSLHMGASSRPATPIGFLMESHGYPEEWEAGAAWVGEPAPLAAAGMLAALLAHTHLLLVPPGSSAGVGVVLGLEWGVCLGRCLSWCALALRNADARNLAAPLMAAALLAALLAANPHNTMPLHHLHNTPLSALVGPTCRWHGDAADRMLQPLLETLVRLLHKPPQWTGSDANNQGAVVESLGVYLLHTTIHRACGSKSEPARRLKIEWGALWEALLAAAERSVNNYHRPRVPVFASQVINLINLCLLHGDVVTSGPEDLTCLHEAIVQKESVFRRLGSMSAEHGCNKVHGGLRMSNIEILLSSYKNVPLGTFHKHIGTLRLEAYEHLDADYAVGKGSSSAPMIIDAVAQAAVERSIASKCQCPNAPLLKGVGLAVSHD